MIKRMKNQYTHLSHPLMSIKQFNGNPFSLQSIQHRNHINHKRGERRNDNFSIQQSESRFGTSFFSSHSF